MKVGRKIVFLSGDLDGFGSAISNALLPSPNSSFRRLEDSFELPLDKYGIEDAKAGGKIVHFVDREGSYEVSVLLMESYEPPTLVCAVNEILEQITNDSSTLPTILAPFLVSDSKLKFENKFLAANTEKIYVYGVQVGPETDTSRRLASKLQKPPPTLQINFETLSCFLHLTRALKLPTSFLIGLKRSSLSDKSAGEELQVIYEIGELLESSTGLCFSKDKIKLNPSKTLKENEEPWQALYG